MRFTLLEQKNTSFHEINNDLSIVFGSFEPNYSNKYFFYFIKSILPNINVPNKPRITVIKTPLNEYHIKDIE